MRRILLLGLHVTLGLHIAGGLYIAGSLAGCGPGELVARGDATTARDILTSTLEAWQKGHVPEQLRSADPAVVVADEDWRSGRKLDDYQLLGEPEASGGHWRICVRLAFADDRPAQRRRACYAVTLGSPHSVIRADFLD